MSSNVFTGERRSIGPKSISMEQMIEFESVVWQRDPNVHSHPEEASKEGLNRPIASGQHQMAFFHELLEGWFGEAWTHGGSISTRWIQPVRPDDQLMIHGEVVSQAEQAGSGLRTTVELWCEKSDGTKTGVGTASVTVADDAAPSRGPLDGVKVLELSLGWAGPYCGMMLADMGADVIKVERPDQDPEARGGYPYVGAESAPFLFLHKNKRSLTIDLKQEASRVAFVKLVAESDVVIQNFRPGVMERLGLGYEALREVNPRLVYATISAYGATGPYAHMPGLNMTAQAVSGLTATNRSEDGRPRPLVAALCDNVAGMWAAYGIMCALRQVQITGIGQEVDTSLFEAGLGLGYGPMTMHFYGQAAGGAANPDVNAPSTCFKTLDGEYVAVFASYPALWDRFLEAIGDHELGANPKFDTRDSRTANAAELHEAVEELFLTESSHHWVALLEKAGVPVAKVGDIGDAIRHPQAQARDMVVHKTHPVAGVMPLPGVPVKLSSTPGSVRTAAPLLGQHTQEVLRSVLSADEFAALEAQHAV